MEADGYLVIADNRDEGACCDSRALGFVEAGRIRGEIVLRLGGATPVTPTSPPASTACAGSPERGGGSMNSEPLAGLEPATC
jgi:hypothetical protein